MRKLYWLMIPLLAFNLSGCGLMLLGGAGAGGYYVGSDERPAGTIADDATITASVNASFVSSKEVSAVNINVDTYRGVVTLYGSVPSAASAQKAVSLAQSVKGVRQVVSKLTVVPN